MINTAFWAHVGGLLTGVALALLFRLFRPAMAEHHLEIGRQLLLEAGDLDQAEVALREALRRSPDCGEALVLLAGLLSRYRPSMEGADCYRRGIPRLVADRPELALEALREYGRRYAIELSPSVLLRLAGCCRQAGDLELARRCYLRIGERAECLPPLREKALYQAAQLSALCGDTATADACIGRLRREFPDAARYLVGKPGTI